LCCLAAIVMSDPHHPVAAVVTSQPNAAATVMGEGIVAF
ncbi:hypothetical protein A2U01_0113329, partial [Trifolium medium]|nr:hypothetical protein [Trifolium medium]